MAEPKVRFRRDNGNNYPNWENKKIGNILKICHGKDYKHYSIGKYPVIGTGGVMTYIDHYNCDWACALIGRKGTINKPQYWDTPFWAIDTIFYSKPKINENPKWQYYLFNTINWLKIKTGIRPSLTVENIEDVDIFVPCLEEQQKIADFLSSVDEVISASEEEVANLEMQKKTVMKKIFSQEVRFKKDDGSDFPEWEEKNLQEVCMDFIVPMRDKPKVFNGNIPWCRIEDLEGKYFNDTQSNQYVSEKVVKEMNLKVYPTGTVICSCSASLGIYAINTRPLITNQTFIGLVCGTQIYNEYLLYYMMTQTQNLKLIAGGTTIPYISREKFEKFLVVLPCLEEQHLIAEFLSNFDEAISSAKKELELWKELKKGLLQQMFV